MEYLIYVSTLACIYVILAVSLNLLVGYTGIFSFAHAAFYGIGAYASAIVVTKLGVNFLPAIVAAIVITAAVAAAVGVPALRTGGDYFVLACFALQIVTTRVLNNWVDVTGGPYGITGVPRPRIFDFSLSSGLLYFPLAAAFALLVVYACWRLVSSPYGLTLQAIREDELVTQVLGRDVTRVKIAIFAISAGLAAIGGGLYAYYIGVVDPGSFGINEIILLWASVET
ncbi:MAG: branched-chain amino acid ABC transporter permease, partial [Chloroflexi bacterium]|nr:branched-chain amino acid ABC transporter permease [Chloroflexota bacterium]